MKKSRPDSFGVAELPLLEAVLPFMAKAPKKLR